MSEDAQNVQNSVCTVAPQIAAHDAPEMKELCLRAISPEVRLRLCGFVPSDESSLEPGEVISPPPLNQHKITCAPVEEVNVCNLKTRTPTKAKTEKSSTVEGEDKGAKSLSQQEAVECQEKVRVILEIDEQKRKEQKHRKEDVSSKSEEKKHSRMLAKEEENYTKFDADPKKERRRSTHREFEQRNERSNRGRSRMTMGRRSNDSGYGRQQWRGSQHRHPRNRKNTPLRNEELLWTKCTPSLSYAFNNKYFKPIHMRKECTRERENERYKHKPSRTREIGEPSTCKQQKNAASADKEHLSANDATKTQEKQGESDIVKSKEKLAKDIDKDDNAINVLDMFAESPPSGTSAKSRAQRVEIFDDMRHKSNEVVQGGKGKDLQEKSDKKFASKNDEPTNSQVKFKEGMTSVRTEIGMNHTKAAQQESDESKRKNRSTEKTHKNDNVDNRGANAHRNPFRERGKSKSIDLKKSNYIRKYPQRSVSRERQRSPKRHSYASHKRDKNLYNYGVQKFRSTQKPIHREHAKMARFSRNSESSDVRRPLPPSDERDWDADEKDWDADEKDWDAAGKNCDANEKDWDADEKDWDADEKNWDAEEKDWDAKEKDWNANERDWDADESDWDADEAKPKENKLNKILSRTNPLCPAASEFLYPEHEDDFDLAEAKPDISTIVFDDKSEHVKVKEENEPLKNITNGEDMQLFKNPCLNQPLPEERRANVRAPPFQPLPPSVELTVPMHEKPKSSTNLKLVETSNIFNLDDLFNIMPMAKIGTESKPLMAVQNDAMMLAPQPVPAPVPSPVSPVPPPTASLPPLGLSMGAPSKAVKRMIKGAFDDFDVLSMSEMRAQEAAEQQAKLLSLSKAQRTSKLMIQHSPSSCSSSDSDKQGVVKALLPSVAKDFRKLKTLESNLQRIGKMRSALEEKDDLWDELFKVEKLFQVEKTFLLQKYAKSELLSKSKKHKKNSIKNLLARMATTATIPTTNDASPTSQTLNISPGEFPKPIITDVKLATSTLNVATEKSLAKTTATTTIKDTLNNDNSMMKNDVNDEQQHNENSVLSNERETIKLTISPIKLPKITTAFQMAKRNVISKNVLLELGDGDDDDNNNNNNNSNSSVNDHDNNKGSREKDERKRSTKDEAIIKPTMDLPPKRNSSRSISPASSSHVRRSSTDNKRIRNNKTPERKTRGRRSRSHSPYRERSQMRRWPNSRWGGRNRNNSPSRSRSVSGSRIWNRRGASPTYARNRRYNNNINNKYHHQNHNRRSRSPLHRPNMRSRERSMSTNMTRSRRPRTPLTTPPPSAEDMLDRRAHTPPSPYWQDRRSPSRSPLNINFKPPSPPPESRSPTPHKMLRRSRSSSWSPDRYNPRDDYRTQPYRGNNSDGDDYAPHGPRYQNRHAPDDDDNNSYDDMHLHEQNQYFEHNMGGGAGYTTNTDSYYYDMPPDMHNAPMCDTNNVPPSHHYDGQFTAAPYTNGSAYHHMPPNAGGGFAPGLDPYFNPQYPPPNQQPQQQFNDYGQAHLNNSYQHNEVMTPCTKLTQSAGEGAAIAADMPMDPNYFLNYPPPSHLPAQHDASVLKVLTKPICGSPSILQKGNVLEIVPTPQETCNKIMTKEASVVNPPVVAPLDSGRGVIPATSSKPVTPVSMKKSINARWNEEVASRQASASIIRMSNGNKGIMKSSINNAPEWKDVDNSLPSKQKVLKHRKEKKQVFFEDGIYPNCNSSDEDRRAVEEQIVLKVRRLRKRYHGEELKITSLVKDPLSDDDEVDAAMQNLPPPMPPPGMPPPHLEQPHYLRQLPPDNHVFFHFDPIVNSMFVSAHERALPPRLLDPKKTAQSPASDIMMSLVQRSHNNKINQMPSPLTGGAMIKIMSPHKIVNKMLPGISAMPSPSQPTHVLGQQSGGMTPINKSVLSARNEFVTQPLYPTMSSPVPPPVMSRIGPFKAYESRSTPPAFRGATHQGMISPLSAMSGKVRHTTTVNKGLNNLNLPAPLQQFEHMLAKGTPRGMSPLATFNALPRNSHTLIRQKTE